MSSSYYLMINFIRQIFHPNSFIASRSYNDLKVINDFGEYYSKATYFQELQCNQKNDVIMCAIKKVIK